MVDDFSIDGTVDIVRRFMASEKGASIQLLKLNRNRGKGGAIKAGIEFCRGQYILMADADGATDVDSIALLYEKHLSSEVNMPIFRGKMGMTIGSRAHLAMKSIKTRSFIRTVLMKGFHLLVQVLCSNKIKDTQCGFKLFNYGTAVMLFRNMHIHGWAFDVELIYTAESLGIPITEIDVNWKEIEGSKLIKSPFDVVSTSLTMARDMLCIRACYYLGIWSLGYLYF